MESLKKKTGDMERLLGNENTDEAIILMGLGD